MAEMYLYNGVKLPKIPPTEQFWGVYEYPKVMLALRGTTYFAYYGWSAHFNYHANDTVSISGYCCYSRLIDGEWESPGLVRGAGTELPISVFFWANFNITDGEGNIIIADSEPVPVLPIDHKAMLQGWIVGKRLAAMRGKRKPVAYLYNGVWLPKLPEWDKEQYPYAWIEYLGLNTGWLFVSQTPLYATGSIFNNYIGNLGQEVRNDSAKDTYSITFPRPDWEDQSRTWKPTIDDDPREFVASLPCDPVDGAYDPVVGVNMFTVFWSNHDVYDENGTLYLAASDPVPIYEQPDTTVATLTDGILYIKNASAVLNGSTLEVK